MQKYQYTFHYQDPDGKLLLQPRRTHKKSRGGCLGCKARKIKCDEGKPKCSRCRRFAVQCCYKAPSTSIKEEGEPRDISKITPPASPSLSPDMRVHSMSMSTLESELNNFAPMARSFGTNESGMSRARLLQHFQSITSSTLGDGVSSFIGDYISSTAWEQPYAMHMVLALASIHLQSLVSGSMCQKERKACEIAQAGHLDAGLIGYRKALAQAGTQRGDALIGTAFLATFIANAIDEAIPIDAFIQDYDRAIARTLSPMAASTGVGALRFGLAGATVSQSSILRNVFVASDYKQVVVPPSAESLAPALVRLCNICTDPMDTENPYYTIVRLLSPLLRFESIPDNFDRVISFGGRAFPHIRGLLQQRDAKALLMLSYWFALLTRSDMWWVEVRAKHYCDAIVAYLSTVQDPEIQALLPFAASYGKGDSSYLWDDETTTSPAEDKTGSARCSIASRVADLGDVIV